MVIEVCESVRTENVNVFATHTPNYVFIKTDVKTPQMTRFCEFVAGIQHVHPKFSVDIDSARPKKAKKVSLYDFYKETQPAIGRRQINTQIYLL